MQKRQSSVKQRFFNSLKRGTGEAYLLMLEHPNIDFSNLIIKGAIKNYAYDPQVEGSRAYYINRFIKKSKQKDKIVGTVLAELQRKKDDYWSLDQMCDLAVLFYKAGYLEAKDTLYRRFARNDSKGFEFCGQDQLMEVDGLAGLFTVAETIGRSILEEGNWEDSWHVDEFQKKNRSIEVYSELQKAGKKNRFIKAYYQSIIAHKWTLPKKSRPFRFSYDLMKTKIDTDKLRFIGPTKAGELSTDEVERLATDFLQEKDPVKKEQYLILFEKRKFPFDYHALLDIVKGKNPKKTRLVERAARSLKLFKGGDIRRFALAKLKDTRMPDIYLNLLVANYRPGDFKLLTEIANKSDNCDFIHSLIREFIAIYEANKTSECRKPLEVIYNKTNCGICRMEIVRILAENNALARNIRDELPFDSYDGIRKAYRQRKGVIY